MLEARAGLAGALGRRWRGTLKSILLPLSEERRPAVPRVSLEGVQEVLEAEGLNAAPMELQDVLPQPADDHRLLPGTRRDQGRHQLVVPVADDRLPVDRRGRRLGRGLEAQEGVVADLPV